MMIQVVSLWKETIPAFREDTDIPNIMTAYLIDTDKPLPAVVVLPGGGYGMRAGHEGKPIAEFYNAAGFQAFVVEYRVAPNFHPAPLADAQRAIRLVRANAAQWGVDPERIVVCGFSAGGHLAGCTATLAEDAAAIGDDLDAISCRPNGAILCYPVISCLEEHNQMSSAQNLLGDEYESRKHDFTLSEQVTDNTCPCFLWHCSTDDCVPLTHSLLMADALAKHGIPCEMHVFPHGPHGLGLAEVMPDVARWAEWSADWIRRL